MKRVGPALGFGLAAVALLAAALLLPGRLNPVEPRAEATLRAAAALLETHSVSGARVDWPKELSEALAMVEGTARRSALEGALEQLIRATGQRHTYYLDPDAYRKATQDALADSASLGEVQRLAGGIVAVTVKGYRVLNEDVWQQDAQRLRGQPRRRASCPCSCPSRWSPAHEPAAPANTC